MGVEAAAVAPSANDSCSCLLGWSWARPSCSAAFGCSRAEVGAVGFGSAAGRLCSLVADACGWLVAAAVAVAVDAFGTGCWCTWAVEFVAGFD